MDMNEQEPLECLNFYPVTSDVDPCHGKVEYRMPLSATGVSFPRCERHWDLRLRKQERLNRDYPDSPIAPSWFDPANAGETWDEDY